MRTPPRLPAPRSLFCVAVAAMRPGQSLLFNRTPCTVRDAAQRYIGSGCFSTRVQKDGNVRLTRKR